MTDTTGKPDIPPEAVRSVEPLLLFHQFDLVMLTLDGQGLFTSLNPAAQRMFGRAVSELIGQPFETVLDLFSRTKGRLMIEETFASGGVRDWELDHLQPGQAPILIGYTTSVLRGTDGEAIGIAAIGRDLTGEVTLAARLAESNQELEGALLQLERVHTDLKKTQGQLVQSEKMRSLGQMVAGVAHELNTPVAFIANNLVYFSELLPALQQLFDTYAPLKKFADANQQAAIARAESAAQLDFLWTDLHDLLAESRHGVERINGIIQSLRNFARLDEAEMKEANLNEGLASTVRIVRPLCKERVEIVEQYETLPSLLCRPSELNQVFLNLLTNAIQAVEGEGRVTVSSTSDGRTITVQVQDTGIGMEAATLARVGEPFFTTKPVGAGSGLGLAVSFGIVERHRGQLALSSTPGEGTTATVILPVQQ